MGRDFNHASTLGMTFFQTFSLSSFVKDIRREARKDENAKRRRKIFLHRNQEQNQE
jgi:hypothetical protein